MVNCGALRPSFLQAKLPAIRSSPPRYELYLHIEGVREMDWTCRARFFGISTGMMRNILVDHARKRRAAKRGSGNVLPLSGCDLEDGGSSDILWSMWPAAVSLRFRSGSSGPRQFLRP